MIKLAGISIFCIWIMGCKTSNDYWPKPVFEERNDTNQIDTNYFYRSHS